MQSTKYEIIEKAKQQIINEGLKPDMISNILAASSLDENKFQSLFPKDDGVLKECFFSYLDDCDRFLNESEYNIQLPREALSALTMRYIDYMIENENIFRFLFYDDIDFFGKDEAYARLQKLLLDAGRPIWNEYARQNLIPEEKKMIKMKLWNFSVLGQLTYYINRNLPADYRLFTTCVEQIMKGLF